MGTMSCAIVANVFGTYQSTLIISSPQGSVSSDAMRLEPLVSRMVRCALFTGALYLREIC